MRQKPDEFRSPWRRTTFWAFGPHQGGTGRHSLAHRASPRFPAAYRAAAPSSSERLRWCLQRPWRRPRAAHRNLLWTSPEEFGVWLFPDRKLQCDMNGQSCPLRSSLTLSGAHAGKGGPVAWLARLVGSLTSCLALQSPGGGADAEGAFTQDSNLAAVWRNLRFSMFAVAASNK